MTTIQPSAQSRRSPPLAVSHDPAPGGIPPILIVAGLGDSGPGHWQYHWLATHPGWRRVVQPDWDAPQLNTWAAAVARAIDSTAAPPILVAHSFGCLATVRAAHLFERRIAGALLVAPPDPDRFGAESQLPDRPLPYPAIVVASNNDSWIKLVTAGALATRWGARFVALDGAGHVNAESGHDQWPQGLLLLDELILRASAGTRRRITR
jgi:predicted alpha/beta hydrolase family esterase